MVSTSSFDSIVKILNHPFNQRGPPFHSLFTSHDTLTWAKQRAHAAVVLLSIKQGSHSGSTD